MKNILIATLNMNIGGVEKSLVSLLNSLSSKEYNIDLLLLEKTGRFMDDIPDWVNVIELTGYDKIKADLNQPPLKMIIKHLKEGRIFYSVKLLFAYMVAYFTDSYQLYYKTVYKSVKLPQKEYDIAISYSSIISYLTYLVIYRVKAKKKYGWIHFDVSKYGKLSKDNLKMHGQMDKIYVASNEAYDSFTKSFPTLKSKCEVKYNVIDKAFILKQADESVENIRQDGVLTIVTLGRLSKEKGQDIVPKVAKLLLDKNIKFKWYLIGDGKLRAEIEEEAKNLGVEENVILLGTKKNPYPYLKQANLYVQTSVHEGFCITIAEAKVFDLPIISTDFAGAHEQLDGKSDCQVVKREKRSLADAISNSLLGNSDV